MKNFKKATTILKGSKNYDLNFDEQKPVGKRFLVLTIYWLGTWILRKKAIPKSRIIDS